MRAPNEFPLEATGVSPAEGPGGIGPSGVEPSSDAHNTSSLPCAARWMYLKASITAGHSLRVDAESIDQSAALHP